MGGRSETLLIEIKNRPLKYINTADEQADLEAKIQQTIEWLEINEPQMLTCNIHFFLTLSDIKQSYKTTFSSDFIRFSMTLKLKIWPLFKNSSYLVNTTNKSYTMQADVIRCSDTEIMCL